MKLPTRLSPDRFSRAALLVLLATIFAAIHGMAYAAGIHFDASPLEYAWQYLDLHWLQNDLLRSCFYLHSQPPLFNLFLGGVLKIAAQNPAPWYAAIFLAGGFALYAMLFALMRVFAVSRGLALAVSTLFIASPPFLLYEHWLFYTLPVATLVTALCLLFAKIIAHPHSWMLAAFFVVLLLLAGIRSLFHLVYFLFMLALLLVVLRSRRRTVLAAALLPLILILALYVKNALVFGKFTSSTWLGMNAWTMTARNIPLPERQALIKQGVLSDISAVERFSAIPDYPPRFRKCGQFAHIPALCAPFKSDGGKNFNHIGYIGISDAYLRDALVALKVRPFAFAIGLARAWFGYFKAANDYLLLEPNRAHIRLYDQWFSTLVYGKIPFDLAKVPGLPIYSSTNQYVYAFLLNGLPLLVIFGVGCGLGKFRCAAQFNREQKIALLFLCLQIAYVAFVGNTFEVSENNRFRFSTDPLSAVLLGIFLQHVFLPRIRQR